MYGLLIVIHIIASLILVASILLQSSQGAGLSEAFGGKGLEQTIFGTRTTTFLTRMTAVGAVAFILASLFLAVLSSKRGESLIKMEKVQEEMIGGEVEVNFGEAEVKVGETEIKVREVEIEVNQQESYPGTTSPAETGEPIY